MTAYYEDEFVRLFHGDCLDVLRELPDCSVDAVVTDPPYNLAFMGRAWDDHSTAVGFQDWCRLWATECLRVLKPGGHMLAFGGTRTFHRLACAVEDAGFEIRDSIAWLYGSGFPKSLDVSKAIDKRAYVNDETHRRIALVAEVIRTHREAKGMERAEVSEAVVGTRSGACWNWEHQQLPSTEMWPAIKRTLDIPDRFDGLIEGTREMFLGAERAVVGERMTGRGTGAGDVAYIGDSENRDITAPATPEAEQWQGWGTALKPAFEPVVVGRKPLTGTVATNVLAHGTGALNVDACRIGREEGDRTEYGRDHTLPHANASESLGKFAEVTPYEPHTAGRWPANVVLDESQAVELDKQSGVSISTSSPRHNTAEARNRTVSMGGTSTDWTTGGHDDQGGASRFFYTAKADQSERVRIDGIAHPTVKPLSLMRWLVRLVTPPGGTVLEPFAGSGTTVEACLLEGFQCIAIERESDYLPLIVQRINRRRDPVAAVRASGDDAGLFDLLDGGAA